MGIESATVQMNLRGLFCGEYIVWFVVGLWWVFSFKKKKNGEQESQKSPESLPF